MALAVDDDRLDETFAALANTTRRAILARLAEGEASVNELAEPFELTLPAISKHIKVLEQAGLVVRSRRAQYRPCALDATRLEEVSTWAEQYRRCGRPASTGWTDTSGSCTDERRTIRMSDRAGPEGSLVIERIFDAPVEAVWALWTDPEQFAAWYGPNGASIPVADMDVRVGGLRRVGMEVQTPNGPMSMWFTGEYREIVENRRLVYTESMSDEDGNVLHHPTWAWRPTIPPSPKSSSNSTTSTAAPG